MKKFRRLRLGAMTGLAALVLAAPALAAPINPMNTRPVTVDPTAASTLQTQLNTTFGAGTVNVNTDQSTAGMWGTATGIPASSLPTLTISNGNPGDIFGIWFGSDDTNILAIPLIGAGAGIGDAASITNFSPGSMRVLSDLYPTYPGTTITDARINPYSFGFYVQNANGTFYTVDQLNVGGAAAALSFTDGNNNWLLAFDDGSSPNTPGNFATYAVKTESIDPVPEPGTLALFGTALFGLAFALRSRQRATE
jgi:hypothetical protein